jgi:predicted RNase H-like HicB family nuclease
MNKELIFLVEEDSESGFVAKALGESIFTQADTVAELKTMIKDAILCYFEVENMPKIIRLHFVKEEVFAL